MRTQAWLLGIALVVVSGCSDTSGSVPTAPGASVSTSSGPQTASHESLLIVATYQPVCGPQPITPDAKCAPEPVADVEVTVRTSGGDVAATMTTDVDGRAAVDLPSGDYIVVAGKAAPPRITPPPTPVTVTSGTSVTVTMRYESSFQ